MPRRTPNPKPLLAVLMGVAFFGGSCTVQKMLGPARETPSDQEVARLLGDSAKEPESGPKLIAAAQAMVSEQIRVGQRYHPYAMVFGLVLVTLYSFAFVFGLRAWNFAHGATGPLAKVAVLVLPARVAVAAVDLAAAKALEPATQAMVVAFAQAQKAAVPPEQAEAVTRMMSQAAPWVTLSLEIGSALFVCVLFQVAWRYFQRKEVVAYFDKMAGPPPDPEE
ncbi:MAG TPA: hypothetical protein VGK67_23155 [Myxococcales bacterium]|jgi:hypothetical protein